MNKNEKITIELTRNECDTILMSLREVVFEIDQITNHKGEGSLDIEHTFMCFLNLDQIADLYNVISTILGYETRITLIDMENNK